MKKILIANRGEIALRVLRACKELGMSTLVVYSQADEQSLAVQLADEAICIGPPAGKESYLRSERILSAAEIAGADAIHPGYGFLSENEQFAQQCEACNITFIGPRSEVIAKMGDKAVARQMAQAAGVPVIPGSDGPVKDFSQAQQWAQKIGFPVIIKAVSGGGGKGMRVVEHPEALKRELEVAQAEAQNSFNDASVYLEKYIQKPRHIEIQVLADRHGHVLHLAERECSIQRRHQKVIEEAPSPFVTPELRARMGAASVRLCQHVGYENAGTIEYLVDAQGQFYFIEMNTRIQVEHGVTEEVIGIDLVREQIKIAFGAPLPYRQEQIVLRKHAIEARICAEDPARNFAPCPGQISLYCPPGGLGIRVDSHVYAGYKIPPYYDSMIGKVIAIADTREEACVRLSRALGETLIRGVQTNVAFVKAIVEDPAFRKGAIDTSFIESFLQRNPIA